MRELWRMVRQTRRIATLERMVDGQWRELAEAEDVVAAVMYDYEQLKAVLAVREREIQCKDAQIAALQRIMKRGPHGRIKRVHLADGG